MTALNPPMSKAVVDVPDGSVDHFLAQGWTRVEQTEKAEKPSAPKRRRSKSD